MKTIKTKATIFQEKKEAVINKIEDNGYEIYSPHGWEMEYMVKKKRGIFQPSLCISFWDIDKKIIKVEGFNKGWGNNKVSEKEFISEFEKKTKLSLTKYI